MGRINKLKSIQGKLIISFVILIFITNLVTGIVNYKTDNVREFQKTRQEVLRLASTAALLIDGDSHEKLTKEQDQLSDTYREIRAKMQSFKKETGVRYIYTLALNGEDKTKFIIDTDEEEGADLGYEYDYLPAMENAFNGTSSVDTKMNTDEWGTFLSGYAPVKNSEGKVVAIVGLDLDVSYILAQRNQLIRRIAINMIFSMILTLILVILLSRKIVKPIHYLVERFEELSLSGGDLTQRIEINTGDELEILGNAVTRFIGNIREIVEKIIYAADGVASSADGLNDSISDTQKIVEEVTSAIQGIAEGASEQAGNVNDISCLIQNIAADINGNEKYMYSINNSVEKTKKLINNGVGAVNNQTIKTEENMNAFKKVTEVVQKLAEEVKEVETILSTITNISEQTNLLALNAAIEAARAGEHGKGFSIVADEVRKLAEGSTVAVSEIGQIIQRINVDTKDVIEEINNADLIAKEQKVAVDSTGVTFNDMTKEIEGMIDNIQIISTSFKEISNNTNNIANKIQDISSVSEENVAIVEEVSASSEEQNASIEEIGATAENLHQLSQKLKEVIFKFKI
jgi:methyl-accepting chemotaxis protein